MAYFECLVGGSGDGSTLTVTCYSGFAGLTISITNGVDTFTDVCPSTSPYEVVFDGLVNGTWTISTVYNGETYTQTVKVNSTVQFYPIPDGATVTPIDDIQTWLFCGGIFDKNYTTISQVLSDTSTLLALINSNNAADYMARSTTFASGICADSTAMTYIGANNYCANTLLADSTWQSAICNSAYFESVLNVKVPTMTSNSTPSGSVVATQLNTNSYYAFDGVVNNWASTNNDVSDATIGYEFTNSVKIYMAIIQNTSSIGSVKYNIRHSDNGSSWTDDTNAQALDSNYKLTQIVSNSSSHLYWGVRKTNVSTRAILSEAQFFGRYS